MCAVHAKAALLAAVGLLFSTSVRAGASLPIYLEDSHAGSFYWTVENLPLDEEYTLVLFDAHSDASQIFDSDAIRKKLRESPDRQALVSEWRTRGVVQCFEWIEPLMPRPFAKVVWVVPEHRELEGCRAEVAREINAHEMTMPRKEGALADRFEVIRFSQLSEFEFWHPAVVSLDLDYFAERPDKTLAEDFTKTWDAIFRIPNLHAITAAISTPYLRSTDQAEKLVTLFLENSLLIANSRIQFEPFASIGPDRSRLAKELILQGKPVPSFEITKGNAGLQSLLAANRHRIYVESDTPDRALWLDSAVPVEIKVTGHRADYDQCVRVRKKSGYELRVSGGGAEWFVLKSEYDSYNLLGPDTQFAADAPKWIRWERRAVAEGRPWIDESDLSPFLDEATGWGTLRVQAKVGERWSPDLVLRVSDGEGFPGAVQEAFNLPYLLGGSELRQGKFSGPDLALGGDCANLAIYALRRTHRNLPWKTPPQLRPHTGSVSTFSPADLRDGIFADFGSHLAVLMEDKKPEGQFNDDDLFAHQLEGRAEVASLGSLRQGRRDPQFSKLRVPGETIHLVFGGDVMLDRSLGEKIRAGSLNPFVNVQERMIPADLCVVNCESAIGTSGTKQKRISGFTFQAPGEAAGLIADAGIDFVSLANNHTLDYGKEGLAETVSRLNNDGVGTFGSPENLIAVAEVKGLKIALVGFQAGDSMDAIREVEEAADFTVIMPHWGVEHRREVGENQAKFAEELVKAGADLIIGSGPHCIQKSDRIGRVPVFYSLGNFVFDGDGPNADWKRGSMLSVELGSEGNVVGIEKIPVELNQNGLPEFSIPAGEQTADLR